MSYAAMMRWLEERQRQDALAARPVETRQRAASAQTARSHRPRHGAARRPTRRGGARVGGACGIRARRAA